MNFEKSEIIKILLAKLQTNLESLVETSLIARDAATSEESKAENKYDTRGLEASYLAGAQSKRAVELQESIYRISTLPLKDYDQNTTISSTAIIELDMNESKKYFFLLPVAGGISLSVNGITLQTLTVEAPLGRELLDKSVGDSFDFKIGDKLNECEITQIW
jgi:transcription elongation GreA/GreB family factor